MVQRILYGSAAVVFLVIEGIFVGTGTTEFSVRNVLPTAVLSTLLVAAGWSEKYEGICIGGFIICAVCHLLGGLGMINFGVYLIVIFWFMREWIIPAVGVLLVTEAVLIAVSSQRRAQILSSVLIVLIVIGIGSALRWQYSRRLLAEREREQARNASVTTRQELARQLHDTVSRDLAHVVILTHDLARRHPDLGDELEPLTGAAASASRHLRPMIYSIDGTTSEHPLSEVIHQVAAMLTTRSIRLNVTVPDGLDHGVMPQQVKTGSLAIRECGANVLKYAPEESAADLVIDIAEDTGVFSFSMSNTVASVLHTAAMSGGYGLRNLKERIEIEGGTVDAACFDEQWITYITIPASTASREGSTDHRI